MSFINTDGGYLAAACDCAAAMRNHLTALAATVDARILPVLLLLPLVVSYSLGYVVRTRPVRAVLRLLFIAMLNRMPEQLPRSAPFADRVQPHGPLRRLAEGLWIVDGRIPKFDNDLQRIMVIYRPPGARSLLLYSVMCLREETMREIEALGDVAYIFVPCSWHTLDAAAYAERYPAARVVSPAAAWSDVVKKTGLNGDDVLVAEDVFTAWNSLESASWGSFNHRDDDDDPIPASVKLIVPRGASRQFDELELVVRIGPLDQQQQKQRKSTNAPRTAASYALIFNDLFHNRRNRSKDGSSEGDHDFFGMYSASRILAVDQGKVMRRWVRDELVGNLLEELDVEVITVSHSDPVVGRDQVYEKLQAAVPSIF